MSRWHLFRDSRRFLTRVHYFKSFRCSLREYLESRLNQLEKITYETVEIVHHLFGIVV